ncbi:hypothetical protein QCD79_33735, partial [Pseudomonas quasicaspiana]|nr:hypothetical protein [Pseudomonas quasicaspiana]
QSSLWGKARDYLETSLRLQRNPETCAELARLLGQLGEQTCQLRTGFRVALQSKACFQIVPRLAPQTALQAEPA